MVTIGFNEHLARMGLQNKKVLYHYTNIKALYNIVESKKIWLSCPYFLNDKSEILYGIDLIKNLIGQIELEASVREKLKSAISIFGMIHHIFVFSLSKHENLLSQWRGYTNINTGVCIGFSEDNLRNRANENGIDLIECIYDQDKQREKLKEIAKAISKNYSAGEQNIYDRDELIKLLCTIKNYQFHEEGEYRLVSKYFPNYSVPEIKYRTTDKYIMPYTELDITDLEGSNYLFDEVIVGPCDNQNLSIESISHFLSKTGACRKIMNSMLPLR